MSEKKLSEAEDRAIDLASDATADALTKVDWAGGDQAIGAVTILLGRTGAGKRFAVAEVAGCRCADCLKDAVRALVRAFGADFEVIKPGPGGNAGHKVH